MTKRKQYSDAFKVSIIQEYLKGDVTLNQLARKHDVSLSTFRSWYQLYQRFGFKGLKRKGTGHIYSREFKLSVLHYKQTHTLTNQAVADHFKLPSTGLISVWQSQYLSEGADAFTLKIERQAAAEMNQDQHPKPQPEKHSESDELKRLKRENELLRIELLYQKKLQALAQHKKK